MKNYVIRFYPFRRSLLAASLTVAFLMQGTGYTAELPTLARTLTTFSQHAPARVGIAIEDIASRRKIGVNAAAGMPAASVIKIPVMVEVFRQMEAGEFGLNDRVTLLAHDRDWGWGDLADAAVGGTYTVDRLLRLMITQSDNTATNMLIRRIGRQNINATMRRLHLLHTVLGEDIRSNGNIRSLRTSPDDMVALLDAMAHDDLVDEWSSRAMLAILAGQEHNGLLPRPLPSGLEIAHKTGTLFDTLNDVGIVFLNDGPYAIAVMTTNLPNLDAGRNFIRRVSRLTYDAFALQAIAARKPGRRDLAARIAAESAAAALPAAVPAVPTDVFDAAAADAPLAPLRFASTTKL